MKMRLKVTQSFDSYNNHANFNEIGLFASEERYTLPIRSLGKKKLNKNCPQPVIKYWNILGVEFIGYGLK